LFPAPGVSCNMTGLPPANQYCDSVQKIVFAAGEV
jgi:hypothetical protein